MGFRQQFRSIKERSRCMAFEYDKNVCCKIAVYYSERTTIVRLQIFVFRSPINTFDLFEDHSNSTFLVLTFQNFMRRYRKKWVTNSLK